jgi:hypothetical protein
VPPPASRPTPPPPPPAQAPHPPSPRHLRGQALTPADGASRRPGQVPETRRFGYMRAHWRGELPLLVAIAVSAALVYALVQGLRFGQDRFPLTEAPQLGALLWLAEMVVLVLGVLWWGVGVQRAATRHLDRGGTALVALMAAVVGLGAFVWVAAYWWLAARHVAPDVWDTLTGQARPAEVIADRTRGIVVVRGELEFGSTRALRAVLDANAGLRLVELDSRGGRVLEGLAIGRLLRDRNLDTLVLAECSSACVTAFSGGNRRLVGPAARLGLHSAGGVGSSAASVARANATSDEFIARQGVDLRVLEKGAAVAHTDIWFPEHAVLLASNLATERVR